MIHFTLNRCFCLALLLLVSVAAVPGFTPPLQADEDRVIVIRAGRVITGTGEILEPGEVIVEDGKITLVGNQLEFPSNADVIEAGNQTLMAGMILAKSTYGLAPISRNGTHCDWSPLRQLRESEMPWEDFLESGFVATTLIPSGSGFPGHAVVVHTAQESTDRVLKEAAYLPLSGRSSSGIYSSVDKAFGAARGEIEKVKKAREKWDKEQEEAKKKAEEEAKKKPDDSAAEDPKKDAKKPEKKEFTAPPMNPAVLELVKIIEEKSDALPIVFEASTPGLILHLDSALSKVDELKDRDPLDSFVLSTSRGVFHEVIDLLSEREATLLMPSGLSALPDTYTRIHMPVTFSRSGCKLVTLPRSDNFAGMQEIPGKLAEMVRYGLSAEQAIASVTAEPARFLGLEKEMGTVEPGKQAHLVLFDADPLQPGARVMKTIIAGEVVWDREDRR